MRVGRSEGRAVNRVERRMMAKRMKRIMVPPKGAKVELSLITIAMMNTESCCDLVAAGAGRRPNSC